MFSQASIRLQGGQELKSRVRRDREGR